MNFETIPLDRNQYGENHVAIFNEECSQSLKTNNNVKFAETVVLSLTSSNEKVGGYHHF